ncbi:hypothetical protein RUND412_006858 [Rhizina undulata]
MASRFYRLAGLEEPFDPTNRFQTSAVLPPGVLAVIRLVIATYIFTTQIFKLAYSGVHDDGLDAKQSFSYFTYITYWGLGFYFAFAGGHTLVYAVKGQAPLQRWPRMLQFLHTLLYTTITAFPFLVTVVFWVILAPTSAPFATVYSGWTNVSVHAMNSGFALFEIFIPRTDPSPFIHLPFLILLLAGYLCVAYITHTTEGFYTYSFLNPDTGSGKVAAYCFGILLAIIVVFLIVRYVIWARRWLMERVFGMNGRLAERRLSMGDKGYGMVNV